MTETRQAKKLTAQERQERRSKNIRRAHEIALLKILIDLNTDVAVDYLLQTKPQLIAKEVR